MILHGELRKVVDAVIDRDRFAIRHPRGSICRMLAQQLGGAFVGINVSADGTEQTLPFEGFVILGGRARGEHIAARRLFSGLQKGVDVLSASGVVPKVLEILRLVGKIEVAVDRIHGIVLHSF